MKWSEYFGLAFGSLRERRLRSSLTILMVVIGASLMSALNGMNAGISEFVNVQVNTLGANVLIVSQAPLIQGSFGPRRSVTSQLVINDHTVRTITPIEGVEDIVPFYRGGGKAVSEGSIQNVVVVGMDASGLQNVVPMLELAGGEFPSASDHTAALVGSSVAEPQSLSKPFVDAGKPLTIEYSVVSDSGGLQRVNSGRRVFIVKGVLKPIGNTMVDDAIFILPTVANAIFKKGGEYDGLYVVTADEEVNDSVESGIKAFYRDNISVTSQKAILAVIRDLMSGFNIFILSIAGVSMLVGAIGIVTTLFTSVMERTREIGVLKAIGFSSRQVMMLFLSESVTIGITGGTIGLGAGAVLANLLIIAARSIDAQAPMVLPIMTPVDLAFVWTLSVILSCTAGLYPAWRAAKLTPMEALRKE